MPSKQTTPEPSSATESPAEVESPVTQPTAPAPKRFWFAVLLFGAWLVFLIYLAFLTWSGK